MNVDIECTILGDKSKVMLLLSENDYGTMPTEVKKPKTMENPKQQLIERIKTANNVLVTVSANPSVDQLSAAIGLTLMLNKMGKHATAVFSGQVPSTIEFLQPEKTLEKNTDSLRDFIIALDKSKADKLRYKVEDDHVKIFITPYRTSISEKDLDFSQGDFNVEVVVALGVLDPKDLDQAITAHGRILHDATTISVTTGQQSALGSINWSDSNASSLCEMVATTADALQANLLDGQMATALMTGIVAETHRFSNEKTTPTAMSASAKLMAAGANQQLVASSLQEPTELGVPLQGQPSSPADTPASQDGSLSIDHVDGLDTADMAFVGELPDVQPEEAPVEQVSIDDNGTVNADSAEPDHEQTRSSAIQGGSSLILEPPTLGGQLTANSEPEHLDPSTDPLAGGDHDSPILTHDSPMPPDDSPYGPLPDLSGTEDLPGPSMTLPSEAPQEEPVTPDETPADAPLEDEFSPKTLSDIEQAVDSPHLDVPEEAQEPAPQPDTYQPPMPTPPAPEPETPAQPDELAAVSEALSEVGTHTTPAPEPDLGSARDAISAALAGSNEPLPPIAALNAQPLDLEIKQTGQTGILDHIDEQTGIPEFKMPDNLVPPNTDLPVDNTATQTMDPSAPPPVPPPLMPEFDQNQNSVLPPMPSQDQNQTTQDNPFGLPPA